MEVSNERADDLMSWMKKGILPSSPYLLMVPLLLFAALLRFHDLDLQSLWFDELMTWARSNQATPAEVIRSAIDDVWAPGYSVWMWTWMRTIGTSTFLLRFPAALAGVMSAAAMYVLGRRLAADARVGVFAAALTAILQVSVYYSQEARPYSALILYTTLSSYFWLRLMEDIGQDKPLRLVLAAGYATTMLAALYVNYFGLVLLGLHGLGAGLWHLTRPRRWAKLLLLFGIVMVGYAPWVPETLNDLGREAYYLPPPKGYVYEGMLLLRFFFNARPDWAQVMLALTAAALAVDGGRALWRKERVRWEVWTVLIGWMALPYTVTYIYSSLASKSVLVDRYLLISFPAWVLLVAWMLTRLPLPRPLPTLVVAGMSVLLMYNLVVGWGYYHRPTKAQFREATAYAVEHSTDLPERPYIIAFDGTPGTEEHFNYTFKQMGSDLRVDMMAGYFEEIPQLEALIERQDHPRFIWLVSAFNLPNPAFIKRLEQDYEIMLHEPLYRAEVWLFEVDG
ncbi:MAG: glycosyltransferase family 39 protein [Anaerolineae bacterium]|nr:glycosyltransferase family 39 protein [Anaerolineae bacterium]